MLVVRPRTTQGAGIFDVFSKVANSALAKKVINSAVGKKVIQQATKENFKKVANSALGKQLQTAVVQGVADASEKAANATLQKFGISSPVKPGFVAKTVKKASHSGLQKLGLTPEKEALDQVFAATTLRPAAPPTTTKKARKRKISSSSSRPGRRKKVKRAKAFGTGIIWE